MKVVPPWFYRQSAAIPYRIVDGGVEILLMTSRRKRWIVPKGIVEPMLNSGESAAKEAYDEAGVLGTLSPTAIGAYSYRKWGGVCSVDVFLLEVRSELDTWPEVRKRKRRWHAIESAAGAVTEPALRAMILALPSALAAMFE